MTATPESPDPASLDEQLVAFLDGELDEDARHQVELLLASDPALRARLETLGKAWQMLDLLERPEVDDTFTETTLELVAVAAEAEAAEEKTLRPRRQLCRRLAMAGCLLSAGLVGFVTVGLWRGDPDRELLENLPVLENFDEYRRVESVEFLRRLHEAGLFRQDLPDDRQDSHDES